VRAEAVAFGVAFTGPSHERLPTHWFIRPSTESTVPEAVPIKMPVMAMEQGRSGSDDSQTEQRYCVTPWGHARGVAASRGKPKRCSGGRWRPGHPTQPRCGDPMEPRSADLLVRADSRSDADARVDALGLDGVHRRGVDPRGLATTTCASSALDRRA
jgi:hypothetical protein